MKKLNEVLPHTQNTATKQASLTKTHSGGQGIETGKAITQSAKPLIDHRENIQAVLGRAKYLKSLMQQKKPSKKYGDIKTKKGTLLPTYVRQYWWVIPDCTDKEKHLITESLKPMAADRIIDLLARYLAMHKQHVIRDEEKRALLYADIAQMCYGIPEYAMTLGIMDLLNDKKHVFFPTLGEIRAASEEHIVKWPENLQGGEVEC